MEGAVLFCVHLYLLQQASFGRSDRARIEGRNIFTSWLNISVFRQVLSTANSVFGSVLIPLVNTGCW